MLLVKTSKLSSSLSIEAILRIILLNIGYSWSYILLPLSRLSMKLGTVNNQLFVYETCQMVSQFNLLICTWFLTPLHNLNNTLSFFICHCLLMLLSSFSRCNVVCWMVCSKHPSKSYNSLPSHIYSRLFVIT